jgi:hypothetical protein
MTLLELSYCLFTLFNGLRIVSYLPQIYRVATDTNGASAIACSTWTLWTAANASTGFYAWVNLGDPTLAAINVFNAFCCALVIVLTAIKRQRLRRAPRAMTRPLSLLGRDSAGRSVA